MKRDPKEFVRKVLREKMTDIVEACKRCTFHLNGKALPFFGTNAQYLMVGEAPHVKEVELRSPFVGDSGEFLFTTARDNAGLDRDDFIIFNSVMCKPDAPAGKTTGKPTKDHINGCVVKRTNIFTYLYDHFDVRHILVLGNYARYIFTGQMGGIDAANKTTISTMYGDREFKITYCLHPSACLHNPDNRPKFIDGIKHFGEAIRGE